MLLGNCVATIDTEISSGDVSSGVAEEEGDCPHEILWSSHLTLWNQAGPFLSELWVIVENLLGSVTQVSFLRPVAQVMRSELTVR